MVSGGKKKKIFITGIAGFLGSHLADAYLARGHEVAGCDNLLGGYLDNVPEKAEFHQIDCCDLDAMSEIIAGADVVYHAAATAYEGLSVFSPVLITRNIVQATVTAVTAAIQNGVGRFVYCSSMARYGEQSVIPFTENMTPHPKDPYGIGKLTGEKLLENLATIHGMEYVIAVPHNIIGPRQKYDDPFRNVASIMINMMLQGKQPIVYGDGNQQRCFSYIDDVISILLELGLREGLSGQIFNIGPDGELVTINGLVALIAEILDFKLKPIFLKNRPQEVMLANCSADRARKLLGYNPQVPLRKGLVSMIEYIKKRGPKPFCYHLELEIINGITPKSWKDKML